MDNWKGIFLSERPLRPQLLLYFSKQDMNVEEFNTLILDVWSDTEFPSAQQETWQQLWDSFTPNSEQCKILDELFAEPRVLYRAGDVSGRSWTTERSIAEWFANRFQFIETIHERVFNRNQVLLYTNERNEHEVVVDVNSYTA